MFANFLAGIWQPRINLEISDFGGIVNSARAIDIPALTGLRIIAALWVVIEHFQFIIIGLFPGTASARNVIEGGYLGVEVFFVLSGFIIAHNYAERFERFNLVEYRKFLQKRLARIYPVHLVSLAIILVLVVGAAIIGTALNTGNYSAWNFLMNIFLLQAVPPATAWNGPAWSISAEAGAYVVFPLLAWLVLKFRSRMALLSCVAFVMACAVLGQFMLAAAGDYSAISHGSIWLRIATGFSAGVFLWRIWSEFVKPGWVFDILVVAASTGILGVLTMMPGNGPEDFLSLPFVVLLIVSAASATGPIRAVLGSRWFLYGGRISYSLYMIHVVPLMVGGKILPWEKFADSSLVVRCGVVIAYFAASIIASIILFHLVEEPGRKAIQRLGGRRKPSADLSVR